MVGVPDEEGGDQTDRHSQDRKQSALAQTDPAILGELRCTGKRLNRLGIRQVLHVGIPGPGRRALPCGLGERVQFSHVSRERRQVRVSLFRRFVADFRQVRVIVVKSTEARVGSQHDLVTGVDDKLLIEQVAVWRERSR